MQNLNQSVIASPPPLGKGLFVERNVPGMPSIRSLSSLLSLLSLEGIVCAMSRSHASSPRRGDTTKPRSRASSPRRGDTTKPRSRASSPRRGDTTKPRSRASSPRRGDTTKPRVGRAPTGPAYPGLAPPSPRPQRGRTKIQSRPLIPKDLHNVFLRRSERVLRSVFAKEDPRATRQSRPSSVLDESYVRKGQHRRRIVCRL
jgi:hypothetical protein